jgi:soluble lytic murein transglycosylase
MGGIEAIVTKRIAAILVIVVGVLALYNNISWFMKYLYPLKFKNSIVRHSGDYGVDPYLVAAVIKVESGFSPQVVSDKGAVGLMQVMPETAAWAAEKMGIEDFDVDDLEHPDINIKIGTWYLATLLKEFNWDVTLALAAYNGGVGNVRNWLKNGQLKGGKEEKIPFVETRSFVARVKTAYRWYRRLYEL